MKSKVISFQASIKRFRMLQCDVANWFQKKWMFSKKNLRFLECIKKYLLLLRKQLSPSKKNNWESAFFKKKWNERVFWIKFHSESEIIYSRIHVFWIRMECPLLWGSPIRYWKKKILLLSKWCSTKQFSFPDESSKSTLYVPSEQVIELP